MKEVGTGVNEENLIALKLKAPQSVEVADGKQKPGPRASETQV